MLGDANTIVVLCTSDKNQIMDITNQISNLTVIDKEVSFTIPYYINGERNSVLDLIKENNLLLLDDTIEQKYFTINYVNVLTEIGIDGKPQIVEPKQWIIKATETLMGYINKLIDTQPYELILCKPDRTQIAYLTEIYDLVYNAKFAGIDEIEFKIPYYIEQDHKIIKNPNWDLIQGDYLILFKKRDGDKYFIIDTAKNSGQEINEKIVHCYSLEYELSKKIIKEFKGYADLYLEIPQTIVLRDENGNPLKDIDGNIITVQKQGILNYMTTLTSWSINYVHPDLLGKTREFNIVEKSWLEVAYDLQKEFQCVFLYDTVNKTINIEPLKITDANGNLIFNPQLGTNKGLYITDENYINTFEEEIKHDEIVTRLYVYGKDGVSINKINPTGVDYIEDFSFYKNTNYMSESLIQALDNYEALVQSKQGEFNTYLNELSTLYRQLYGETADDGTVISIGLYGELANLQEQLKLKENEIDVAINVGKTTGNVDLTTLKQEKDQIETNIQAKEQEIQNIENQINAKYNDIDNLKNLLAKENNFTPEQLTELDYFVREKIWRDNNQFDINELYQSAKNVLSKLSQPPIEFTISVVDFLQIVECQHDWNKLKVGDLINIQFTDFDTNVELRLIEYSHNVDGTDLVLTFSNKNDINDSNTYLEDILKQSVSTSTVVDMSRFKWDKSENNETTIKQILTSAWDSAKQAVLAGQNQEVVINERGISLTDSSDVNKLKQLRLLNNVIAMTTDGWQTASLAITPQGIFAERLIGKIIAGENLIITNGNNTFQVDSQGVTIDGGSLTITNGLPKSQIDSTAVAQWDSAEQNAKNYTDNNAIMKNNVYNGVKIDTTDGLTITRSDNKSRLIANATVGLKIQSGDGSGTMWTDKFYADTNGNLIVQDLVANNITLKDGKIQDKNGITLIDLNTGTINLNNFSIINGNITANNIDATNLRVNSANIDGIIIANQINLKGLTITDSNNNISFAIDSNGNVTLGGNITWNTKPNYTYSEIGGTKPPEDADNTLNTVIEKGMIYEDGVLKISADKIVGDEISTNLLKIGYINGIDNNTEKEIRFSSGVVIKTVRDWLGGYSDILISAMNYWFDDGDMHIGLNLYAGTSGTYMWGTWNFSNATIIWGSNSPTAVFG